MRLTKAELEEATGATDVHALVDLSLTNKYIDDLGYLSKLTQLQEVSLAFNDLRSVEGLSGIASSFEGEGVRKSGPAAALLEERAAPPASAPPPPAPAESSSE